MQQIQLPLFQSLHLNSLQAEELVSFYAESDFLISLNSKANIYKYVVSVSLGLVNFDAEYMIQRLDILLLSLLMP